MTAAAACSHSTPPSAAPARNPPAPDPLVEPTRNPPPPSCPPREAIRAGEACETGLACYLPTDGCQPSGYRCVEGVWREISVTCNPPPAN